MRLLLLPGVIFLVALFSVFTAVLSIGLGIERDIDWEGVDKNEQGIELLQSYSGIIEFEDKSVPGDKNKMKDGQFINLARLAYEEMVNIWEHNNWPEALCPRAMIAMESEGSIYFASSLRWVQQYTQYDPSENVVGSVSWFFHICTEESGTTHQNGGNCAEPNALRLYGERAEHEGESKKGEWKSPPKPPGPRVAVWGREKGEAPRQGKEKYFKPCSSFSTQGWGCDRLTVQFGFRVCDNVPVDNNGEDGWKFGKVRNPRSVCLDA